MLFSWVLRSVRILSKTCIFFSSCCFSCGSKPKQATDWKQWSSANSKFLQNGKKSFWCTVSTGIISSSSYFALGCESWKYWLLSWSGCLCRYPDLSIYSLFWMRKYVYDVDTMDIVSFIGEHRTKMVSDICDSPIKIIYYMLSSIITTYFYSCFLMLVVHVNAALKGCSL